MKGKRNDTVINLLALILITRRREKTTLKELAKLLKISKKKLRNQLIKVKQELGFDILKEKHADSGIEIPVRKVSLFPPVPHLVWNEVVYLQNIIEDADIQFKLMDLISFVFGRGNVLGEIKTELEAIIRHNRENSTHFKRVAFLYRKPLSLNTELKKVIPVGLENHFHVDYLAALDYKDNRTEPVLKIYRLDRIVEIYGQLEIKNPYPTGSLSSLQEQIRKKFQETFENADSSETVRIEFLYDPQVEMSLKNYVVFEERGEEKFRNSIWKKGSAVTKFPEHFLDMLIPFAGFVYIAEPEKYNNTIKNYFVSILESWKKSK